MSLTKGWFVPEKRVWMMVSTAMSVERSGTWIGLRVGHILRYRLARSWGVHIHPKARLGAVRFPHPSSIVIGARAVVEDDVRVYQQVTIGSKSFGRHEYPVIRSGATIYPGSIVVGSVEIGKNAIVGANSTVVADVPEGAIVAGNPAKVIGYVSTQ